jgi:hypothetical protein
MKQTTIECEVSRTSTVQYFRLTYAIAKNDIPVVYEIDVSYWIKRESKRRFSSFMHCCSYLSFIRRSSRDADGLGYWLFNASVAVDTDEERQLMKSRMRVRV